MRNLKKIWSYEKEETFYYLGKISLTAQGVFASYKKIISRLSKNPDEGTYIQRQLVGPPKVIITVDNELEGNFTMKPALKDRCNPEQAKGLKIFPKKKSNFERYYCDGDYYIIARAEKEDAVEEKTLSPKPSRVLNSAMTPMQIRARFFTYFNFEYEDENEKPSEDTIRFFKIFLELDEVEWKPFVEETLKEKTVKATFLRKALTDPTILPLAEQHHLL